MKLVRKVLSYQDLRCDAFRAVLIVALHLIECFAQTCSCLAYALYASVKRKASRSDVSPYVASSYGLSSCHSGLSLFISIYLFILFITGEGGRNRVSPVPSSWLATFNLPLPLPAEGERVGVRGHVAAGVVPLRHGRS